MRWAGPEARQPLPQALLGPGPARLLTGPLSPRGIIQLSPRRAHRALDKTKLTGNEAGVSTASEGDNVPWNGRRALWGALSQVLEQLEQLVKNSTRNTQTG